MTYDFKLRKVIRISKENLSAATYMTSIPEPETF